MVLRFILSVQDSINLAPPMHVQFVSFCLQYHFFSDLSFGELLSNELMPGELLSAIPLFR